MSNPTTDRESLTPCPACGADQVGTFTADNTFLYGFPNPVRLVAKDVEFFRCMGCGVEFTGEDGERKREQAVKDYLARSPGGASGNHVADAGKMVGDKAVEELERLRHYVATCGGTDNDGRCPMHHLAGVSPEPAGNDAKGEAHSRLMRALYEWKNAGGSVDEVADSVRQMAEACNTPTKGENHD